MSIGNQNSCAHASFPGPRDWGRLLTAVVTPFQEDGTLDERAFQAICAHLVDNECNDGLVVNGTTGESPTLSFQEKIRILELAVEAVGDRAAVVFGAGTYNTQESIETTEAAEKAGAHGIMLVNPYYNKPGQEGLYAHFSAVASRTSLPVMLYNISPRSSINLETETLLRLLDHRNIVAVKEASGVVSQISDVCRLKPDYFRVYSGDDGLTLPMLALGAHGLVSVVAHVVGKELKELIQGFATNPARSAEIHHQLTPIFKLFFSAPSPTPIKQAMAEIGLCGGTVRLPLVPVSEAKAAEIREALKALKRLPQLQSV